MVVTGFSLEMVINHSLGRAYGSLPSRVAFFIWIAALGKILKIDNLQKRICDFWFWIGFICVNATGNFFTIFYSAVL